MKNFSLYGLNKPGEEARYIGITPRDVNKRLKEHLKDKSEDHRGYWIAKLKKLGTPPEIVSYCVGLDEDGAKALEIEVIAELRKLGVPLVNTSPGGNMPPNATGKKRSEDTKKRMSESQKGNQNCLGVKRSPESIEKTASKRRGEKHYNFGETASPETKEKMSLSQTARRQREKESRGGLLLG